MKSLLASLIIVLFGSFFVGKASADVIAEHYHSGWYILIHDNDTVSLVQDGSPGIRVDYNHVNGVVQRFYYMSFKEVKGNKVMINGVSIAVESDGNLFNKRHVIKSKAGRKQLFESLNGKDFVNIDGKRRWVSNIAKPLNLSVELIQKAI